MHCRAACSLFIFGHDMVLVLLLAQIMFLLSMDFRRGLLRTSLVIFTWTRFPQLDSRET